MGFFDRFSAKKNSTPPPSQPPGAASVDATPPAVTPTSGASAQIIGQQLAAAREKLDQRKLPEALALYDQILTTAGDRPDVLVTISGDLGSTGYVENIIELIAPRYDAERHGPATGLNLLQAYLAVHNTTAAQHLLDILFGLGRPDLQERLFGFSNALAELIEAEKRGQLPPPPTSPETSGATPGPAAPAPGPATISLVSISKPIWFYGLESLPVLATKGERLRRIAFGQLSLPGLPGFVERMKQPEDELGRLSRAIPLWLAETFYQSPLYSPIAAVGLANESRHYAIFPTEWTTDHLRQLVETSGSGLDYIFTGALRDTAGDTELILRVWEVKKFRERKQFTARWTPATADTELARLHEQIRLFMEWAPYPAGQGVAYRPPSAPRAWLDVLGASLTLFLGEKGLLAPEQLASAPSVLDTAAEQAAGGEAAGLAWLTFRSRARRLGLAPEGLQEALLPRSPLIEQARTTLA